MSSESVTRSPVGRAQLKRSYFFGILLGYSATSKPRSELSPHFRQGYHIAPVRRDAWDMDVRRRLHKAKSSDDTALQQHSRNASRVQHTQFAYSEIPPPLAKADQ